MRNILRERSSQKSLDRIGQIQYNERSKRMGLNPFEQCDNRESGMKTILCIGDSNTFGYDPRSFFGSQYPPDVRWTGLLKKSGWRVCDCGQNGMSVPGEYAFPMMEQLIRSMLPVDLVTVMLGSNDLLQGATAEETAERMSRFLPCAADAARNAGILLLSPPVMRRGDWVQSENLIRESARLAERYRKVAEDTGTFFADTEAWGVELSFDGVHFSPAGHAAFARHLSAQITALCGRPIPS